MANFQDTIHPSRYSNKHPDLQSFIRVHRDLIAGRKKAIGWGASNAAPFFIENSPYPFCFLIDSKVTTEDDYNFCGLRVFPPEILNQFPHSEYAIILLADEAKYGEEIRTSIRRYGSFDVVGPLQPPEWHFDVLENPRHAHLQQLKSDRALRRLLRKTRTEQPISDSRQAIALFIGSLSPGGAERQIVLLALGLRQLGYSTYLLTIFPDGPAIAQWNNELEAAGVIRIRADITPPRWWSEFRAIDSSSYRIFQKYSRFTDLSHLHQLVFLFEVLTTIRPLLLVTYLDDANVTGGIAGIESGIPKILMSGRNQEPNAFPSLGQFLLKKSRMHHGYRALISLPGVYISNNTRAGAASYARWLSILPSEITVIPNAFQASRQPQSNIRASLSLSSSAKIVLGVMRLSDEKDPLLFVQIVEILSKQLPDLIGILIGDGPLRQEVEQYLHDNRLAETIRLIGVREDVLAIMSESDLLLLTSRDEGMPNVLLEGQYAECPIVATAVGGVPEALSQCWHPFMFPYPSATLGAQQAEFLLTNTAISTDLVKEARRFLVQSRTPRLLASGTITAVDISLS